ncbi:lysophosphatidic acid receptor 6 [Clupea harengus]|uniref:Lysophosphatidic acid receptor 6 n=1 Tax=Clupea harengus TaxID=7950 RepID=A0A6P3VPI1_CLUHA|nr:lysophosphatidic acid receptor 6 [Clupea harengus]
MSNTTQAPVWEECKDGTEQRVELIFVSLYVLIFVAGLILNLTALVVFFCHTKTRSHTTVYMTNLALADLFLVCTLPVRIYYHLGFQDTPPLLCEIMGVVLLINMYGSIFLLSCISFDRCVAVCFPMSQRVREGRKRAPFICLAVWVITIGASLPIYLIKPPDNQNQTQTQCFGSVPIYATRAIAVTSSLITGFGVPLLVMLISSWGLIRAISHSQAAQSELVDSRKIQRMIAICLIIFLCCFLPYHLNLWLIYLHQRPIPCGLVTSYRYSLMVACLNAVLDPLAYYFTTETFRERVDLDVLRMWPTTGQSSENNRAGGPLNT